MQAIETLPSPLTREFIYELVWSEPMTKVAERFQVSSSYMARVCSILNIPRPERGHWAKLAVGRIKRMPPLPEAPPGLSSKMFVNRHEIRLPKALPQPPSTPLKRKAKKQCERPGQHALVVGAREHFGSGRLSYDGSYLRPSKRLLPDMVVTRNSLDKALTFANELFLALEEKGHRVAIATSRENLYRAEVDQHEVPNKSQGYNDLWSPQRCTVVYIGTVAIGLTVIEISEEAKARYVRGEYVREEDYVPPKRGHDHSWTTTRQLPTGRLRLQAYSPYQVAKWSFHWDETKKRDLISQIKLIIRKLEQDAIGIVRLVQEGEQRAELERQQRERRQEEWRKEEAERRRIKAYEDSREEILQIIDHWAKVNHIEQFFRDAERRMMDLEVERRSQLMERLNFARAMVGSVDALDHFLKWKAPSER